MARQRRGGGFKAPGGTLGTLLRTAAAQVGPLRDALERTARTSLREGRSRLDDALSGRRRSDALAELGEIVLELIRAGEIDIAELPEVQDIVAHLDELDSSHPEENDRPPPPAPRNRFDSRARPAPRDEPDDGAVSSRGWRPPTVAKPGDKPRVWRPPVDDDTPAFDEPTGAERPAARANPAPRKGGISFEDDDLADYMHPDDVPSKKAPGSDS